MATETDLSPNAADILVVDDSIASLRMLTEILTREGHKVRPVDQPQLALQSAFAQPPSLILLDVKLPNMSGMEVCRRLKLDERTREVPIIFVSALDELPDRIRGFEAGAVDYIVKPFQEAEILARVNTHLRLRNTQLYLEELVAGRTAELEELLKERTQALISAEEQIDWLFENSPVGISLTNREGVLLTANKAVLDMLRISEEELQRRKVPQFYIDRGTRERLLEEVQQSGSVQEFSVPLVRNGGELFFANLTMSRLLLMGEEVLLTMIEDVTDEIMAKHEASVREERRRLARELHDAVTQTLYSARMIADSTPDIWEDNASLGRHNLEFLSILIEGALAEMRTLLLELRPEELTKQTLDKLLATLADAARARTRATVSLEVEGECLLPADVTLALHRITQEALNNVAKHAEASEVRISLTCRPEEVELQVVDNGRGFDPHAIPAGHLGIGISRERAQKIGANLQIDSEMGEGTSVVVNWSQAQRR